MGFELSSEEKCLQAKTREFVNREIRLLVPEIEQGEVSPAEVAQRVGDQAVQIHDGNVVLMDDFPVERLYRKVRAPSHIRGIILDPADDHCQPFYAGET